MTTGPGTSPAVEAPRWLSEDEQRAWVALAHLVVQLPTLLDAQLQRDAELNLFEYFVLSRLSMSPDHTLRMSELSEMTGGSLSRLSNVVKRLEQQGFLERHPDPDNRRYTNAILSEAGLAKVVEAATGHVAAVRRLVVDPLDERQVVALAEVAERLLSGINGACEDAGPDCC